MTMSEMLSYAQSKADVNVVSEDGITMPALDINKIIQFC